MLRLTLDTNCVIHAAQAQAYGPQVDELAELGRGGRVGLWITTAFKVDQERASDDNRQRNLAWAQPAANHRRRPGAVPARLLQLGRA
jgi:hypothetical protein